MGGNEEGNSDKGGQQDSLPPVGETSSLLDKGQLTSSQELKDVFCATFPQHAEEIVYAFGYGSGVFVQTDQDDDNENHNNNIKKKEREEKKMLDMILIVKDALRFHSLNSQINPSHYAPLFRTNPVRATWWQKHDLWWPNNSNLLKNPKIFFNFVEEPPLLMKYGIMEQSDLCSDLKHWDSLYIAGRMHKPTATIYQQDGSAANQIETYQINHNLPAALCTALLLFSTKSRISLTELYNQISALSYTGDFRMQMGAEDPSKITKLVHSPGQLERFHQMYLYNNNNNNNNNNNETILQPLIRRGVLSLESDSSSGDQQQQEQHYITWNPKDPAVISALCQRLPPRLQQRLDPTLAAHQTIVRGLQQELHSIVAPAARYQSFKGLWTAGLTKSAKYAFAKLSKGILRRGR